MVRPYVAKGIEPAKASDRRVKEQTR
jgi:hypothetical protein